MRIEVDMSGKIEDYLDTVVAFRNKEQYTVLLKRKIKNEILNEYRKKSNAHRLAYRTFAGKLAPNKIIAKKEVEKLI